MKDLLRRTQYLLSETDPKALKPSTSEIAFVGRSNAGKSSLMNALCEHKGLADVSKMPGRTRKINVYAAAHLRWLIDLPGYGFSMGSDDLRKTWQKMIENYLASRHTLRAVFLLFDSFEGPMKLDYEMVKFLVERKMPYVLIGNKVDKIPTDEKQSKLTHMAKLLRVPVEEIRWVSATHGHGISELRKLAIEFLGKDQYSS